MSPVGKILATVLLAIAAPFLAYAILTMCAWGCFAWGISRNVAHGLGNITEKEAERVFHAHRAECNRLRDLLVASEPYPYLREIPPASRVEADRLLRSIGARGVSGRAATHSFYTCEIDVASYGNFFHRACVAFVWVPSGEKPKDDPPRGDDPDFTRYTSLGEGWFLKYWTM